MAFELPDFWTTAGIGLALLSLVPGMTSVPSVSHIEFRVSRLCALAAATLFLIKLALWGSEELTAPRLALVAVFGALIAVSAAFALHWINQKEKAASLGRTEPINHDAEKQAPPPPPPSEDKSTRPSFMRIGQGGSVEGITIQRGQIEGVDTVFDVDGKLKDVNLQDFKSSSAGSNSSARMKEMKIRRVTFTAQKVGAIQSTLPTHVRNSDGTFISSMSFIIDEGVTVDLVIGMKDGGLIEYAMFKDDKLVPAPSARTKDGWNLRRLDKANGTYLAKIRRTTDIESLNVGLQEGRRY